MRTRVCVRDVETNVLLVEVLQRSFSFRQNELATEELSVVSTSFPQKALSVPYTKSESERRAMRRSAFHLQAFLASINIYILQIF